MKRALGLVAMATLVVGCAADPGAGPRSATADLGESPICSALPALVDLRQTLGTNASIGASSEVGYLVDADQEIGSLRVARRRLQAVASADARALDGALEKLAASLEIRREQLASAIAALRTSREAVDEAIASAARCDDVDLRAATATLSAKCTIAARLWSSVRSVHVGSADSCQSIASHLGELRIEGPTGEVRDDVARSLRRHASALRALELAAAGKAESEGISYESLLGERSRAVTQLEAARSQCLATMRSSDRVVGTSIEPRRATVTVRPTWGDLAALPGADDVTFGSGFVVRWRNDSGDIETRIVTNAHVMNGAFAAEIVSGDAELGKGADGDGEASRPTARGKNERGWKATLVSSDPVEDIAILRVEPAAGAALQGGLSFRLEPAVEQELVTAAGFPGIGARPSFQVSKGTVSNSAFGTGDRAKTAEAFVQHTAPVDPGNSGGPLLDDSGRLMGMTTFKIVHRENVALAVPTPRIQLALLRAEEKHAVDPRNVEAACNAVAAALSVDSPHPEAMNAFGVALFEPESAGTEQAARWRKKVASEAASPIDEARRRAYGAVRADLEAQGGVRPYETCTDVRAMDERFTSAPRFVATLRTRSGSQKLVFAEEHGAVRLISAR